MKKKIITFVTSIKRMNPVIVFIVLFILILNLTLLGIPNILRYRVESLFGSAMPLLWAEGVNVFEEAESWRENDKWISEALFLDSNFDRSNLATVRISNVNRPKLWLYGSLVNSADSVIVTFNGKRITKGVNLNNSEIPYFWETFYLDKYFGVWLPPPFYEINEFVITSGTASERYLLQMK